MTKEEKFKVIMERCDKYWEICFECPIWKYMQKNNIGCCDELSVDEQYEILINDGT